MPKHLVGLAATIIAFSGLMFSQPQQPPAKPQTARQALIEMVTHGGAGIEKHLTIEVQDLLKSSGKGTPWGAALGLPSLPADVETFDIGDTLLAYTEPVSHAKYEVQIDGDDFSADEETFSLSIHRFLDGKEQDNPLGAWSPHFTVSMKMQQHVWRVNQISVLAEFPIGDPAFVKKTFLTPAAGGLDAHAGTETLSEPHAVIQVDLNSAQSAPLHLPPEQITTFLGMAERNFANLHPDAGFTCSLKDLTETSKVIGIDEQVNNGTYDGYRYALSGCEGSPVGSFQIVAEPLTPGARAFCTDATANVRVSDDGRGANCLANGQVQREDTEGGGIAGFRVSTGDAQPPK